MMVIPVSSHKLIKIRKVNRKKLTKLALVCSFAACTVNLVGSFTNNWIYTIEVLQYYSPNNTRSGRQNYDPSDRKVYHKNATMGPFQYCWCDPVTPYHCEPVSYFQDDDPSDVTGSVQQSLRRSFPLMLMGMALDIFGFCLSVFAYRLPNPYRSLLFASIVHINAGIANFVCIIVYMSALSKEVGNKIFPASEFDDPLFHFHYGYSFLFIEASFLLTEMAAAFSIVVYMAKRDERTFNRYKLKSLLAFAMADEMQHKPSSDHYDNTRFGRARRPSICSSVRPNLDSLRPKYSSSIHPLREKQVDYANGRSVRRKMGSSFGSSQSSMSCRRQSFIPPSRSPISSISADLDSNSYKEFIA